MTMKSAIDKTIIQEAPANNKCFERSKYIVRIQENMVMYIFNFLKVKDSVYDAAYRNKIYRKTNKIARERLPVYYRVI